MFVDLGQILVQNVCWPTSAVHTHIKTDLFSSLFSLSNRKEQCFSTLRCQKNNFSIDLYAENPPCCCFNRFYPGLIGRDFADRSISVKS